MVDVTVVTVRARQSASKPLLAREHVNLVSCQWPGAVTLRHAPTALRRHTRWEY